MGVVGGTIDCCIPKISPMDNLKKHSSHISFVGLSPIDRIGNLILEFAAIHGEKVIPTQAFEIDSFSNKSKSTCSLQGGTPQSYKLVQKPFKYQLEPHKAVAEV